MPVASTAAVAPISAAFARSVRAFAHDHQLPWVDFAKGQRKDDVAQEYLAAFTAAGRAEGSCRSSSGSTSAATDGRLTVIAVAGGHRMRRWEHTPITGEPWR